MMRKLLVLSVAIGVLCCASISNAELLIGSFESGDDGWVGTGGATVGQLTAPPLAHEGTGVLALQPNGNDFIWAMQLDNSDIPDLGAQLELNPYLKFGVTFVRAQWTQTPGDDWVRIDNVSINGDPGWAQSADSDWIDPVNPSFPGSYSPSDYPDDFHYREFTIDLSTALATGDYSTSGFIQLNMSVNSGPAYAGGAGQGFIYFDNIRLVPEPATASLLGLGGIMMFGLFRRRRS